MAKQSLPSVDNAPQKQTSPPEVKPEHAPIAVEGYLPRRVDVKMGRDHAVILRDKLRKLQDDGARLKDGTEVSDKTKAMLWILENLEDVSAT